MAHRLIARFPTVVAAWHRIRSGKDPMAPSPELGHAANFLYMLNGRAPDETATRAIDTALVLHAEHAFNASTFAAREVASTQAHMYAAVAAGVGSLSGALHGGANARSCRCCSSSAAPTRWRISSMPSSTRAARSSASGMRSTTWTTPGRTSWRPCPRRWGKASATRGGTRCPP